MKSAISAVIGVVAVCSVSVAAQWGKYPTPGVPRDAQGKVNMDAPTPRTADGKPDLSGHLDARQQRPARDGADAGRGAGAAGADGGARRAERGRPERPQRLRRRRGRRRARRRPGRGGGRGGVTLEPATAPFPFDPNGPPVATFFEAGGNMEGGLPYTPWAADDQEAADGSSRTRTTPTPTACRWASCNSTSSRSRARSSRRRS